MTPSAPPSDWILRFVPLIGRPGRCLDLACGGGRHVRALLALGHGAVGIDIDPRGVADLARAPGCLILRADLERDGEWPLRAGSFDAVIVTNYLYRPRFDRLLDLLAPGGLLLYETFMMGNEVYGRPGNPAYLLRPDELLERCRPHLRVLAFEQGDVASPAAATIQRIAAIRPDGARPVRASLPGPAAPTRSR